MKLFALTAVIVALSTAALGDVIYNGVTVSHESPGGTTWTESIDDTTGTDISWFWGWSDEWEGLLAEGNADQSQLEAMVFTDADFASAASSTVSFTLTESMTVDWQLAGFDPETYNYGSLWHAQGGGMVFGHGGPYGDEDVEVLSGTALLTEGDYVLKLFAGWGNSGLYQMRANLEFTTVPSPAGVLVLAAWPLLAGWRRVR